MNDPLTQQIATDLGMNDLPMEKQEELIAQFGEIALKAATTAILGTLSESNRETFVTLSQSGDAEALQAFLDKEVPGHEELAKKAVADEVARFKAFVSGN